jgi:hypothetical protein
VETCIKLRREGHRVILVSSGAIGIGLRRLDVDKRPKHLAAVQAIAAVGQCRLIALWDTLFKQLSQPVAQILLTRNDIADVGLEIPTCGKTSVNLWTSEDAIPECCKYICRAVKHGNYSYCE